MTPPLPRSARGRAGGLRTLAASVAVATTLAACEQAAELTAPSSAPTPVSALDGRLDPNAIGVLAAALPCESSPFPSAVAGDAAFPRGGTVVVAAGPTTSTTGISMYEIGNPVPGAKATAVDINDGGVVVANVVAGTDTSAYMWTAGSFVQIPALGGATQMVATDISNTAPAVVVGYARFGDGSVRSWRFTGATSEITGGPANLAVRGINDAGMLTGSAGLGTGAVAVRFDGFAWQTIGAAPSSGMAINASGAVAGWTGAGTGQRATFWAAGSASGVDLGLLAGTNAGSQALGLNDAGEVVGLSLVSSAIGAPTPRAFYWSGSGALVAIGGAGFSVPSAARDINNARLVVGYATSTSGGTHAWVWTAPGGPIVDLGKGPTACSSFAYGINEECKIVGHNLIDATGSPQELARWDYVCPPRYSLGDRVWLDADADTQQDVGEVGINGATVALYNSSNVLLGTKVTSGDGLYGFDKLIAGTYKVCVVSGIPATYTQTYDLDGLATPHCATASVGPSRVDVDFGYTPPPRYSLGDRVWLDLDADTQQDAGENGINGVTLTLYDASNTVLGTKVTAGDGLYTFDNLLAGTYKVCVTAGLPANHTQTYDLDGLGTPNCATASVGPSRTDVDFGYTPPRYELGDLVWHDANASGGPTQEAGENGFANVTLTIAGPNGYSASTTTNASGLYKFDQLLAGQYTVCVAASNMNAGGPLAGYGQTYDLDGVATPNCALASVGPNRVDVDFSYSKGKPPVPTITAKSDGACATLPTVTFKVADLDGASSGPWAYTIAWGDGTTSTGSVPTLDTDVKVTKTAQYAAAGPFTVTVTITDKPGLVGTATTSLAFTACGKPPEVKYFSVDCKCGSKPVATFKIADLDGASSGPWSYTIEWGDGTTSSGTTSNTTSNITVTKPAGYPTNKTYTAKITIKDKSGLTATATDTITFNCTDANDLPYPKYVAVETKCGKSPVLTFKIYDDDGSKYGSGDSWTYTVDWGDGTTSTGSTSKVQTEISVTKAAPYTSNKTYEVVVTVKDKVGEIGTAKTSVVWSCGTTTNTPPIVKELTAKAECSKIPSVTFKVYDSDSDAPFTYTVDWGDGTKSTGTVTQEMTFVTINKAAAYTTSKSYTITVTVADGKGAIGSDTETVTLSCGTTPPPTGACTRTIGYWKTHEEAWPKPFSPDAFFMKWGRESKSWDEVFGLSAAGGNSYVQLAHQWMAATLNVASGVKANDDVLKTLVLGGAWLLLKTESDGGIPTIKDATATAWADYLDKFNNGQLGTPHCN